MELLESGVINGDVKAGTSRSSRLAHARAADSAGPTRAASNTTDGSCSKAQRFERHRGRTRVCPHCKATILESAPICPQSRHHRSSRRGLSGKKQPGFSALHVQGAITNNESAADGNTRRAHDPERAWRGLSRQVVGVGALRPSEVRKFTLSVDVITPESRSR